ncbi:MAG TPA: transposase, partial [Burkholderiales bacterium]
HRYDVLAGYAKSLTQAYAEEKRRLGRALARVSHRELRRPMLSEPTALNAADRARLEALLASSKVLATAYELRQKLSAVWARSTASREQLVKQLEEWCAQAEASGIAALREFSLKLRRYA